MAEVPERETTNEGELNFKEKLEISAEHMAQGVSDEVKSHILEKESEAEANEALEMWRDLANALFARVHSDKKNPEMVETVIKMATALLDVEAGISREQRDNVMKGLELVQRRYGGIVYDWKEKSEEETRKRKYIRKSPPPPPPPPPKKKK